MRRKYGTEKKELLQYIQLQNEVYREREKQWQQEYQKLFKQFEQLERETVERDYEEFKAPDTNNDHMISKKEFESYVTKYLSSFPELSEKDFPKFDDFDLDGDGQVSFDEWQEFLKMQKQQEAKKKDSGSGATKSQYAD
jgi:Ca2+-binding EF-hand superfamily protein